jgi:copper(I)-binding protein
MSRNASYTFLLLITIVYSLSACTPSGPPQIDLKGATIVPSDGLTDVASSFLYIINDGNGNDTLTACAIQEYPNVRGQLHDFVKGRMVAVPEIKIPARKVTALKRGDRHLMFFGLPDELKKEVTLVLTFQKSGILRTKATTLE